MLQVRRQLCAMAGYFAPGTLREGSAPCRRRSAARTERGACPRLRSFQEANSIELRMRWTMQVCTTVSGIRR